MANDYTSSAALGGAGQGALAGWQASGGNPYVAAGGGVVGLLTGASANGAQDEANRRRDAAMAEARQRLAALSRQAWDMRQNNTQQALSYWQPAINRANKLTGFQAPQFTPQAYPGDGMPAGPPPGAPQAAPQSPLSTLVNGWAKGIQHAPGYVLDALNPSKLGGLASDLWNENGLKNPSIGTTLAYGVPGVGQVKLAKDGYNTVKSWF